MNYELKNFINENMDLIDQNTKESWEEIYKKLDYKYKGEFTETMLLADIEPLKILDRIPENYLQSSQKIKQILIPNNVKSMGTQVFFDCVNLESVIIKGNIQLLNFSAFNGCSNLRFVELPSSIKHIAGYVFIRCPKLRKINYTGTMDQWKKITDDERTNGQPWHNKSLKKIICTDGEIIL